MPFGHRDQAEFRMLRQAQETADAFLVVRDAEQSLVVVPLTAHRPATLGRREECDLALAWDARVSRVHAQAEFTAGEWWVVDGERSTNGTFVNEVRVERRARLHDGDVLRLGSTAVLFRCAAASHTTLDETVQAASVARAPLTRRERVILRALCRPVDPVAGGEPASNTEIAAELGTPVANVKAALTVLYQKFGLAGTDAASKRRLLAAAAVFEGLGTGEPDGD
ncbi:MAG: FHA domain-containing protein [Thermoleophilia bacterium]